jgi:predicted cobalt transporter CbtA
MSATPLPSLAINSFSATRLCGLVLKLLAASLASAFLMAALATGFQYIRVVPLILESEAYERRRALAEEWAPADGAERGAFTLLSNIIVSFSFSLLLLGLSALDDVHVSVRSGLQRGVAGWAVFMGLPCVGLSPELPGMAAAELTDRQWWWLYAVLFAAAGFTIALLASRLPAPTRLSTADTVAARDKLNARKLRLWLLQSLLFGVAVVVAAIPHMSGAPHPHVGTADIVETATTCGSAHMLCQRSGPPAEMAASFAVWCLGTAFAYWLCLGAVASVAFNLAMGYQPPLPTEVTLAGITAGSSRSMAPLEVTTEAV